MFTGAWAFEATKPTQQITDLGIYHPEPQTNLLVKR